MFIGPATRSPCHDCHDAHGSIRFPTMKITIAELINPITRAPDILMIWPSTRSDSARTSLRSSGLRRGARRIRTRRAVSPQWRSKRTSLVGIVSVGE